MTPMEVSASLTSSSLNGLMIASIFFITDPPGVDRRSNRRAGGAGHNNPRIQAIRGRPGGEIGERLPTKRAWAGALPAFRAPALGASTAAGSSGPLRDAVLGARHVAGWKLRAAVGCRV